MRITTAYLAVALTSLSFADPALAGPSTDLAQARITSIAKGDVAALSAQSDPHATLYWIGGPLDGTYAAQDKISEIWTKFSKAQGAQTATVAAISEAANAKGGTVTADVTFSGKNVVKVRYVTVYRGDKLVEEIWQVNPNASY